VKQKTGDDERSNSMAEMVKALLNGNWTLTIPKHRADRPEWYTDEGWERQRLDAMARVIRPGDDVIDVGAEEGDMSALCALFAGRDGRMYLVEPNPLVWPNIRAIWEANTELAPVADYFVGFAAADTELEPAADDITAVSHVMEDGWPECAHGPVIGDHGFRVLAQQADATPRVTLDALGWPADVITMDVEGAELEVLRGARETLVEQRPVLFVSIHPPPLREWYGQKPSELHEYMHSLDFSGKWLWEDHEQHWMFAHIDDPRWRLCP